MCGVLCWRHPGVRSEALRLRQLVWILNRRFPSTKRPAETAHSLTLNTEQLRKAEIETAVDDATCYRSAGLTELLEAARGRAERVVLTRAQDTVQGLRGSLDNAVARAEAVLAGDPALEVP